MGGVNELIVKLKLGVVSFSYRKKDGSVRKAKGTVNLEQVEGAKLPNGKGAAAPEGVVNYWDLGSNGWRRFNKEDFIEILPDEA